jgi:hypothetical protein
MPFTMEASNPNPARKTLLRKADDILFPLFWHTQCFFILYVRLKLGSFIKLYYFFGCMLATVSLTVWPGIGLAHGEGGREAGGGGEGGSGHLRR